MVPGATVTLTDTATKVAQTMVTNAAVRYIFVGVNPGVMYEITVSKMDFKTAKATGQTVKVGVTLTVDLQLALGRASQTVEVQAAGPTIEMGIRLNF